MAVMNEDTVKPDLRTHALSLYCLGRNESLDPVLAQYIVSDMEKEVGLVSEGKWIHSVHFASFWYNEGNF